MLFYFLHYNAVFIKLLSWFLKCIYFYIIYPLGSGPDFLINFTSVITSVRNKQ